MPLANATHEPIPGYKVRKRIGAGGYGEVWAVEAPGGLDKAIKFVYGYLDEERASRELKALNRIKSLRHPFLISLERIEVVEGQLVIITELADRSLKDRFEECLKEGLPGIPQDELFTYVDDAADALDFMNESHSLQHLDVKPENLLLVGKHVKVADFGLVKELHEVTGSLMGGLTPLYAPPESFDGRPSRRSDQYSLAVLYQEMLTGILPFPGTTAAQLAAQHLHSKPRVIALPPAQQEVILKALAKDPNDRFGSCGEMVEHLRSAARGESHFANGNSTPSSDSASANAMAHIAEMNRLVDDLGDGQGQSGSGPLPTCVMQPKAASPKPRSTPAPQKKQGWSIPPFHEQPILESLPPVEFDTEQFTLQPTLFVGLGGTAGRILAHLSQRMHDRFGGSSVPIMSSLLIETDGSSAMQLAHASEGDFDSQNVLLVPLRRPQDYRNAPKSLLSSISRRWIYNIPRSQQTEGIRPLGRLALLEQADKVVLRLRDELSAIVRGDAVEQAKQNTGQPVDSTAPRVVIVTSISGGTGGGMLMDVAFAARQVLGELGLRDDAVSALLCHSTPRNQGGKDLAVANAYACLSELQYFSRRDKPFPGAATCLKPQPADRAAIEAINIMHLGEELSPRQFDEATERAAEYLYLNTVTPCRSLLSHDQQTLTTHRESWDVRVKTFELFQLGDALEETLNNIAQHLCGRVIQRWRGRNEKDKQREISNPGVSTAHAASETDGTSLHGEATQMAGQKIAELRLDHDTLMKLSLTSLNSVLRAEPRDRYQQLREQLAKNVPGTPSHHDTINAIDQLFGPRATEPTQAVELDETIRRGLDQHLGEPAAQFGSALSEWILQLLDRPTTRLKGAEQAADWIKTYLRDLQDKLGESEQSLFSEISAVLLESSSAEAKEKVKPRGRAAKSAETNSPDDVEDLAWRYFQLRLQKIATAETKRFTQRLLMHVGGAADQLRDLEREFSNLDRQFDDKFVFEEFDGLARKDEDDLARVRRALRDRLQQSLASLVTELDKTFCEEFYVPLGGMHCLVSGDTEVRNTAPVALLAASRRIIKQAQREIDISELLLPPNLDADKTRDMLRRVIASSTPPLSNCGGQQRLTVVLPKQASRQRVAALLDEHCQRQASFLNDTDCDLVMLTTIGEVPLSAIAVQLIDNRCDYADAASRLYTRCDVDWTPWDDVRA